MVKMIVYNYVLSINFIYSRGKKKTDISHQSELHYDTASTIRLYSQVVYTNRTKYFLLFFIMIYVQC